MGGSIHGVLSSESEQLRLSTSELLAFTSNSGSCSALFVSNVSYYSLYRLEARPASAAGYGVCRGSSSSQIGRFGLLRVCTKPECAVSIWFLYHVLDLYFFPQYGHWDSTTILQEIRFDKKQQKQDARKWNLLFETELTFCLNACGNWITSFLAGAVPKYELDVKRCKSDEILQTVLSVIFEMHQVIEKKVRTRKSIKVCCLTVPTHEQDWFRLCVLRLIPSFHLRIHTKSSMDASMIQATWIVPQLLLLCLAHCRLWKGQA